VSGLKNDAFRPAKSGRIIFDLAFLDERQRRSQQSAHSYEPELIKLLYGDKDQACRLIQQAGGNVDRVIEQLIQDRSS
jgi:hypothetical protein